MFARKLHLIAAYVYVVVKAAFVVAGLGERDVDGRAGVRLVEVETGLGVQVWRSELCHCEIVQSAQLHGRFVLQM